MRLFDNYIDQLFPYIHNIGYSLIQFLLRPETIALELSGVQMRDMRAVTREWARFERARPHRKWRPEGEIHEQSVEKERKIKDQGNIPVPRNGGSSRRIE